MYFQQLVEGLVDYTYRPASQIPHLSAIRYPTTLPSVQTIAPLLE